MYSLGIDIGYSSIKVTLLDDGNKVKHAQYLLHKGRVKETLKKSLKDLLANYNSKDIRFGAVTGSGSEFLNKIEKVKFVNEVAAIVEGSTNANGNIRSIIEIGGQSAKYISEFSESDKSRIQISMNSNCSAGTGSFLEEQMSRLNLSLEDYSVYANRAKSIPRIAGRCSVFAKTDITHHQQEGVSVEDILLGLAYALIKNYKGAVIKRLPIEKPILFVGGVAHNQGIITALKDVLNLDENELIIPEYFGNIAATGTAIIAKKDNIKINLSKFLNDLEELKENYGDNDDGTPLPELISFGQNDSLDKHLCKSIEDHNSSIDCYLGVDIGSTSSNLVLMNENNEVISYKYLKTLGNPVEAVRIGLRELKEELGNKVNIIGVGATGSGRYMIGDLIGADVIKDEITSQAKAAVTIDSSIDTVFEIGGQDSKYISLENGIVTDFQMNKICAAGTGSFIEEQAKKFNIPINDFGNIALNSNAPINLGERCTVFIETSIAANLSRGAELKDIASGLCYSIVKNYLNRVVGQKKIANKIFFQGGLAYNQGIINAFRVLTGKDIYIPPFFSVTGAYGAALLAKEEMACEKTLFKGFNIETKAQFIEKQIKAKSKTANKRKFNETVQKLIFQEYSGLIDDQKETVGIPRALFTYGIFPMFNAFFKELGFNVLLSDPSNEETIKLSQEYSLDETCYPIKLVNGHVAELLKKKVDYIFFPDLYTVEHPNSHSRQNYGCAYMQLAFKVVNQTLELDKKGIKLLAPTMAFNLGQEFMLKSFSDLGQQLGKSPEQTKNALQKGMLAFKRFENRLKKNGQEVVKKLKPNKKAFVIISKIYGVADPVLNMGIPDKLMNMGYPVLSFYDLPEGDISKEHPNMFWPFGQHILEAAQVVKQHPNLYPIFLTHHSCGPDTVFTHYFREIMDGKPYLNVEVDEHSSGVGVITRVEAFVNSLNKMHPEKTADMESYLSRIVHKEAAIKIDLNELEDGTALYLPYMYPYAEIFKEILIRKGINAKVLPVTSRSSVDIGRKYTMTNEYFSLAASLGDVLKELYELENNKNKTAFFIPQSEGAEVDGQYNRLLRTILDNEGFKDVDIFSPFIEDLLYKNEADVQAIYLGLLAGDIIRTADKKSRTWHLGKVLALIKSNRLEINNLETIAREIYEELKTLKNKKRIFVIGEPMVLFNDFLNNFTFSKIEDKAHRVIYSSFSESMWLMWRDFVEQNESEKTHTSRQRLDKFKNYITTISECLLDESPFEKNLDRLISIADGTIGYYAGANGRYRESKLSGDLQDVDGIITAASMYENTGIVLNILHKEFENGNTKPILNLTFDGNKNENDETKIESFMYYI